MIIMVIKENIHFKMLYNKQINGGNKSHNLKETVTQVTLFIPLLENLRKCSHISISLQYCWLLVMAKYVLFLSL